MGSPCKRTKGNPKGPVRRGKIKEIVDVLFMATTTKRAHVKALPTPLLEIIYKEDNTIVNKPYESPCFKGGCRILDKLCCQSEDATEVNGFNRAGEGDPHPD